MPHIKKLTFSNPKGLYDPRANGYSPLAQFPAGWRIITPAGQGGETADTELSPDFRIAPQCPLHRPIVGRMNVRSLCRLALAMSFLPYSFPDAMESTPSIPDPSTDLRALERLVGTWKVSGGTAGTVVYEWMEGGYFLLQHVDLEQHGQPIKGLEVIGHLRPFGEKPSADLKSRFYDSMGNTLDYTYELDGDTLMIWGGERGSPAYFEGTFDELGDVLTGEWVYPGGGGYKSEMRRAS